jgi:hypothetical protein
VNEKIYNIPNEEWIYMCGVSNTFQQTSIVHFFLLSAVLLLCSDKRVDLILLSIYKYLNIIATFPSRFSKFIMRGFFDVSSYWSKFSQNRWHFIISIVLSSFGRDSEFSIRATSFYQEVGCTRNIKQRKERQERRKTLMNVSYIIYTIRIFFQTQTQRV